MLNFQDIDLTRIKRRADFIERCKVISLGSGSAPKDITVQLPDGDGAQVPARWSGFPAIAVNDYVVIRRTELDTIGYVVAGVSSSTAQPGDNVWAAPGKFNIGSVEYDTLAAAIAAASSGDTIIAGIGTYTLTATAVLPDGVDLVGIDPANTVLTNSTVTATLEIGNGGYVYGLTIDTTYSVAGGAYAIQVQANDSCTVRNCIVTANNGNASGSTGGIRVESGTGVVEVEDTEVSATGHASQTARYAIDAGTATVNIRGGKLDGDDADVSSFGTANLFDPLLVNGTLANSGTIEGWYYTEAGVHKAISPATTSAWGEGISNALWPHPLMTNVTFQLDNGANTLGFQESSASYSVPGGTNFSVSIPASTFIRTDTVRHFAQVGNNSASSQVYFQWQNATPLNNFITRGFATPFNSASDYLFAEIRVWDTVTPAAGSGWWAVRLNWMGTTYSHWPFRVGLWYGTPASATGLTFATTTGTLVGAQAPYKAGCYHRIVFQVFDSGGTPAGALAIYDAPGGQEYSQAVAVAGQPNQFKTARYIVFPVLLNNFIDDITVS